jgi:hypothetical protein
MHHHGSVRPSSHQRTGHAFASPQAAAVVVADACNEALHMGSEISLVGWIKARERHPDVDVVSVRRSDIAKKYCLTIGYDTSRLKPGESHGSAAQASDVFH